ncbi:DUF1080 domain-containing protein [Winogradskyella sp. R77965]|uniref:DUF1080 domain-containing protein n=1 Tax=Winogradskyella sp. R77965 TaxID=3093872 RepID=UPI0037DCEF01
MILKVFRLVIFSFCCGFLLFTCKNESKKIENIKQTQWVNLLSKNNLDDWIVKIKGYPAGENYKNTFRVNNGILSVDYTEYNDTFNNTFGHIYYKKSFSNYKLKLDYRFLDGQIADGEAWAYKNSGVMLHCEDPKKIGLDQGFPVSIEAQLLGGNGEGARPTGNVCTPGMHINIDNRLVTEHCIPSTSQTFLDDQWIHVELEVYNDSIIKHFINGEKVMEYTKPIYGGEYSTSNWESKAGEPVKSGYISLQSESHPIEFKNIEILELSD